MPWVTSNSPCSEPWWPQVLMNLPSREYLTIRSLVLSPWPSAMKMSPFGATTTSDGPLRSLSPLPAMPGLAVGDPDFAVAVGAKAMRPVDQLGAEAPHLPAGGVEFLDRRDARA